MKNTIKQMAVCVAAFGLMAQMVRAETRAECMTSAAITYQARIAVCAILGASAIDICTKMATPFTRKQYRTCVKDAVSNDKKCRKEAQDARNIKEAGCPLE
jgi:hypothetical protein